MQINCVSLVLILAVSLLVNAIMTEPFITKEALLCAWLVFVAHGAFN